MKTKFFAVLNLFAFSFHLILSYLVQMNYFSVLDVGQVSARYETVFAPAGITFAIWGVIYLALVAFSFFHLYAAFTKSAKSKIWLRHEFNGSVGSVFW